MPSVWSLYNSSRSQNTFKKWFRNYNGNVEHKFRHQNIFVSTDYTVRNRALKIGVIDLLEKPIDLTSLNEMVEKNSVVNYQITWF